MSPAGSSASIGRTRPGSFCKGDRVRVVGHFEVRTYMKDGETKRHEQFVVKTATLERAKIQTEAA